MKIGILATGRPPRALQPEFGDYVAMFEGLLAGHGYDFRQLRRSRGRVPGSARGLATPTSSPARRRASMTAIPGSTNCWPSCAPPRAAPSWSDLLRPPGDGAVRSAAA
ncbi:MAG: hypothetical protein WDM85_14370 [Caulobacteraceae bacterium]